MTRGSDTATKDQSTTTANLGGYRRPVHNLPANSYIGVFYLYTGGNPAARGAVRHIHYREDRIQLNPNSYFVLLTNGAYTSSTWESVTLLRSSASSFSPATINVTTAGGPLTFGYDRSNTNNSTTQAYVTNHGIDNWTVVICR